jgi:spore maturation protein CgeB
VKITIFGLTLSSSWGNGHATPLRAIIRALHRRGHSVTFFEKDVPYYARHRDLISPEFCDLQLYTDWGVAYRNALVAARESDVVMTTSFLPAGAEIAEQLLGLAGPLRVFYDLDTPVTLTRWQKGESVEYIRPEQLKEFDVVLSFTGGRALDELRHRYDVQHAVSIYGCVDPDVHFRVAQDQRFACEFSYMGTYSADRQAKLDSLFFAAARELPERKFMLVGSLFPDGLDWPQNVWYRPHAAASEHAALYSSSRATLNITRGEMAAYGHCPPGRLFEAAACGSPLITDEFKGLNEFFDLERELIVARSTGDVVGVLGLSDSELQSVAQRAQERTLDEHTGEVRVNEMISAFERRVGAANKTDKTVGEAA